MAKFPIGMQGRVVERLCLGDNLAEWGVLYKIKTGTILFSLNKSTEDVIFSLSKSRWDRRTTLVPYPLSITPGFTDHPPARPTVIINANVAKQGSDYTEHPFFWHQSCVSEGLTTVGIRCIRLMNKHRPLAFGTRSGEPNVLTCNVLHMISGIVNGQTFDPEAYNTIGFSVNYQKDGIGQRQCVLR